MIEFIDMWIVPQKDSPDVELYLNFKAGEKGMYLRQNHRKATLENMLRDKDPQYIERYLKANAKNAAKGMELGHNRKHPDDPQNCEDGIENKIFTAMLERLKEHFEIQS